MPKIWKIPLNLGVQGEIFNQLNGREEFHQVLIQTRFVDPDRLKHIVTNFYGENDPEEPRGTISCRNIPPAHRNEH